MEEKPVILRKVNAYNEARRPWENGRYFEVRNQAWHCLIENEVSSLPVDVKSLLARHCSLITYSQAKPLLEEHLGSEIFEESRCFTIFYRGATITVYNEDLEITELNYALAHELGHVYMKHYQHEDIPVEEEAEAFATRVLSPLCVIRACKVADAEELSYMCELPLRIAEKRFERMRDMNEKDKFLSSELERKVLANLKSFIEGYVDYYHKND